MAEPSDESMDQLESEIKNLAKKFDSQVKEQRAAIAKFKASSFLRMDAIQQMLNQLLQHQQNTMDKEPSHGSTATKFSNLETTTTLSQLQQQQQTTTVSDFSNPAHEYEEENEPDPTIIIDLAAETSPETEIEEATNTESEYHKEDEIKMRIQGTTIEIPNKNLESLDRHLQSIEEEGRTSDDSERKTGVEVAASVKGKEEATNLQDPVAETIFGDLQSIDVEIAALSTVKDEAPAAPKAKIDYLHQRSTIEWLRVASKIHVHGEATDINGGNLPLGLQEQDADNEDLRQSND